MNIRFKHSNHTDVRHISDVKCTLTPVVELLITDIHFEMYNELKIVHLLRN